jgi:hypothetical protein
MERCALAKRETYRKRIINGLHHGGKVEVVELVFHFDLGKTGRHGNSTLDSIGVIQPTPTNDKQTIRSGKRKEKKEGSCLFFQ